MDKDSSSEQALTLHVAITRLITELYRFAGLSQAEFGRRMGYSRSQINVVLQNKSCTSRLWTLHNLTLAAAIFGMKVSDIIRAAEEGRDIELVAATAGTKPYSGSRLNSILGLALKKVKEAGRLKNCADLLYSSGFVRSYHSDLCSRYLDGEEPDEEVYKTLTKMNPESMNRQWFANAIATAIADQIHQEEMDKRKELDRLFGEGETK